MSVSVYVCEDGCALSPVCGCEMPHGFLREGKFGGGGDRLKAKSALRTLGPKPLMLKKKKLRLRRMRGLLSAHGGSVCGFPETPQGLCD